MFQHRGTFSVVVCSFWWDGNTIQQENIVLCQPQESFSDLNLTLRSGHLGVVQHASCQRRGKSAQTLFQV